MVVVAFRAPVGMAPLRACHLRVDLISKGLPVGVLTEVWLERGASSTTLNQECPPRFPTTERKVSSDDSHDWNRSTQGVSRRRRDR